MADGAPAARGPAGSPTLLGRQRARPRSRDRPLTRRERGTGPARQRPRSRPPTGRTFPRRTLGSRETVEEERGAGVPFGPCEQLGLPPYPHAAQIRHDEEPEPRAPAPSDPLPRQELELSQGPRLDLVGNGGSTRQGSIGPAILHQAHTPTPSGFKVSSGPVAAAPVKKSPFVSSVSNGGPEPSLWVQDHPFNEEVLAAGVRDPVLRRFAERLDQADGRGETGRLPGTATAVALRSARPSRPRWRSIRTPRRYDAHSPWRRSCEGSRQGTHRCRSRRPRRRRTLPEGVPRFPEKRPVGRGSPERWRDP